MGMVILDKEADDKFKVNLKAISKITEQLKKDSKKTYQGKRKKTKSQLRF